MKFNIEEEWKEQVFLPVKWWETLEHNIIYETSNS